MSPTARSVASPRVVSIADLRAIAQRRMPSSVFDYLDGGADGEVTLRESCRVYEDLAFRPASELGQRYGKHHRYALFITR
jgi:L-lactate dehydrogenase (cytochrome)